MGNDFDDLISDDFDDIGDNEESENTYSSIDSIGKQSIISVINDEGEEELIDLYQFYREKSIKRNKEAKYTKLQDLATENSKLFEKQKETPPSPSTEDISTVNAVGVSRKAKIKCDVRELPFYKDHHLQTALDIQERSNDR